MTIAEGKGKMVAEPTKPIQIFCCYAHKDKALLDELEKHLEILRRSGLITIWYDRDIAPGAEWKREIDTHLNTSDIILLLVTPDFMRSNYCYSTEMHRAIERHKAGEAQVIPIILKPINWKDTPLGELQVLPTEGKPVTKWRNRDEAFLKIEEGIREVVRFLHPQKTKEQWIAEGDIHYRHRRFYDALTAFNQALRLDPDDIALHHLKQQTLLYMGYNEEQLLAFERKLADLEQLIQLHPDDAQPHYRKSRILERLARYDDTLDAIEHAIRLNPNNTDFYKFKGHILPDFEDALAAYEQVIHHDPNDGEAYRGKAYNLHFLGRTEEGLAAIEEALRLNPNDHAASRIQEMLLGFPDWPESIVEPDDPELY